MEQEQDNYSSEVVEVHPDEAIYALLHHDARVIVKALHEYKRLLLKREQNNPRMNFDDMINDTEFLYEMFREIVGHKR